MKARKRRDEGSHVQRRGVSSFQEKAQPDGLRAADPFRGCIRFPVEKVSANGANLHWRKLRHPRLGDGVLTVIKSRGRWMVTVVAWPSGKCVDGLQACGEANLMLTTYDSGLEPDLIGKKE